MAAATMLVAAIGLVGCGEDTAAPPTSSSSTTAGTSTVATDPPQTSAPTTSTTAAPSGDEAEVRAVIDRYWNAWFTAAGNPPDPDNPELNAVLTGQAKEQIVGGIERRLNEGTFVRLPQQTLFSRATVSVSFDENGVATATECVVDDSEAVDIASGEVVRGGVATLRFSSKLKRYPDGWRITESTTVEKSEGLAECAE